MPPTVAPALRALLEGFIDYAGIFPPAKLPVESALDNYGNYRSGDYSWMLRWFVINASEMSRVPESFNGSLSVLGESDESRAASIESKGVVVAKRPVYCEVPLNDLQQLDSVKKSGNFAKVRTGGLVPEAIPQSAELAAFISKCAQLRLPFKATAGLHHPIRSMQPLTYEPDAPRAIMHGFLNVLLASAFAWNGQGQIEAIIAESDPKAFSFDERAHWRNQSLGIEDIREARINFIHSVGSCSFDEPVQDLQALGLL